jgi:hypothetical protein
MDPITLIVDALAAGAAAGLKETAPSAIKDAYAGLKRLIGDKYGAANPSIEQLEGSPESTGRRIVAEEELAKTGATTDAELIAQARALIKLVEQYDPDAARTVGVDLTRFEAGELEVEGVTAEAGAGAAAGFSAQDTKIREKASIKNVHASGGGAEPPKVQGQ